MPLVHRDRYIHSRVDDKLNWNLNNPILLKGEIGFERDTFKYKEGDGINPYKLLDYIQNFDNSYKYIQPRFDGLLDKAITYESVNGGYIQRGNLINLNFIIKARIDTSRLNQDDYISIILYNAPLCHAPNILIKDIFIYGIGPYNESYGQFSEHTNTMDIYVKESTFDHDISNHQIDTLRKLKISDIENEYIEIHGQMCYVSLDECIKRSFIIDNPDPFIENIKKVNYTITEDNLIKSIMFNTEIYLPDETAVIPERKIMFNWEHNKSTKTSGIISTSGINTHNVNMIYDNGFTLVSNMDRNTYNIEYSDIVSVNARFSGTFVYIK